MQKYSHLPQLEVGILFSPEICFRLNGIFTCRTTGKKYTGTTDDAGKCNIYKNGK